MDQKDKEIINETANLIYNYAESLRECNTYNEKFDDKEVEQEYLDLIELVSELKRIVWEN